MFDGVPSAAFAPIIAILIAIAQLVKQMSGEDVFVKGVKQIIPSSGLWLRVEGLKPDEPLAEFVPVVAVALLEVERPHDRFITAYAYMPLTPDHLMYGWVERFPYEGLRFRFTVYHEVDF